MLQPRNDPIRAAAESREQLVAQRLYAAWAQIDPTWATETIIRQLMHYLQPIATDLAATWRVGAATLAHMLPPRNGLRKDFTAAFIFDRLAPQTASAAESWAAKLIREIGDDLRVTLNSTVQEGVKRGLGPEELALNVRDSIGLTRFQARAVQNYRRALQANSPKSLGYRLRDARFDSTTERAIADGAPLSSAQIDARVARYKQRYLSERANTIARYETLYASNAGANASARQINRPVVKRWLLAPDEGVCEKCRSVIELQPDGVPIDEPFRWEHGKNSGLIDFPPQIHPACRCTVQYSVR